MLIRILGPGALPRLVFGLVLAIPLSAGSAPLSAQSDTHVTDDLGRVLRLASPPTRIVSLVPALTEILYALGEGDRLVGRSVWDDEPEQVLTVPSVGDALGADAERVLARNPDLVVLYAGSDNARSVEQFERLRVVTLAIRIDDLEDLRRNVVRLGVVLDRTGRAQNLWASIEAQLDAVASATAEVDPVSVYYDVAWPPAITVGAGSYLDTLITIAGGKNVFHDLTAPSPQVSLEAIVARSPEIVLAPGTPDGGFATPGDRPGWDAVAAVRSGDVRKVDGSLLHRLGPRIGEAALSLARVLHPGLELDGVPERPVGVDGEPVSP